MAIKGRRMVSKQASEGAASQTMPVRAPNGQVLVELSERIARKAYELWEQRGCPEGRDLENWLDAEAIVMDEAHEARE